MTSPKCPDPSALISTNVLTFTRIVRPSWMMVPSSSTSNNLMIVQRFERYSRRNSSESTTDRKPMDHWGKQFQYLVFVPKNLRELNETSFDYYSRKSFLSDLLLDFRSFGRFFSGVDIFFTYSTLFSDHSQQMTHSWLSNQPMIFLHLDLYSSYRLVVEICLKFICPHKTNNSSI